MKLNKVPLKNVCDISMGQSPAGEFYNENNEGYPMIAGAGDFRESYPLAKKYTTEANKLSKIGDIILCIRATIGDINWSDKIYCLGRGVAGLTPKKEKLDSHYLWHFLISDKNTLCSRATGSTFKQVSKNHIEEWEIPLPDLPTQTQIAKILDKSTALIAKRKAQIAELDVLVQSVFLEMFGDPAVGDNLEPIENLFSIIDGDRGKAYPKATDFYDDEFCLFLNTKNVTKNGFNFSQNQFIKKEKDNELRKGKLIRGDLVLTTRGTVGNIAFYSENIPFDNIRINSGMVILRKLNDKVNVTYFLILVRCFDIFSKAISGSAQPQLPISVLKTIKVKIPDFNLQTQFAQIVEKIQTQKSQLQQSLAELEMQHQALMQRAFRGELV